MYDSLTCRLEKEKQDEDKTTFMHINKSKEDLAITISETAFNSSFNLLDVKLTASALLSPSV